MKKLIENQTVRKTLSFEKFKSAVIRNPNKVNGGGDGGWTRDKDKDKSGDKGGTR